MDLYYWVYKIIRSENNYVHYINESRFKTNVLDIVSIISSKCTQDESNDVSKLII